MQKSIPSFLDCSYQVVGQAPNDRFVVNVVFFKLGESDNYKSEDKYVRGLKRLFQYLQEQPEHPLVRIWCDQPRFQELIQVLGTNSDVQLVNYDCPKYKNGILHKQLFGSAVRFLGMSQLDSFICDIDFNVLLKNGLHHLLVARRYIKQHNLQIDFMYNAYNYWIGPMTPIQNEKQYICTYPFSLRQEIHDTQTYPLEINHKRKTYPYIMATFLYSNRPVPTELLAHYMSKSPIKDRINPAYMVDQVRIDKAKGAEYPYGVDEQYLNAVLLPYMIENDFTVAFNQWYFAGYTLIHYIDLIIKPGSIADFVYQYQQMYFKKKRNPSQTVRLQFINDTLVKNGMFGKESVINTLSPQQIQIYIMIGVCSDVILSAAIEVQARHRQLNSDLLIELEPFIFELISRLKTQPGVDVAFLNWQLSNKLLYAHYLIVTKRSKVTNIITIHEQRARMNKLSLNAKFS